MSKLNAAARREIPSKDFGLPKSREYPEQDRGHAIAAEGRAKTALRRGHITKEQYDEIVRKAKKKLGEK